VISVFNSPRSLTELCRVSIINPIIITIIPASVSIMDGHHNDVHNDDVIIQVGHHQDVDGCVNMK
jgi:hypothetical protein